MNKLAQRPVSGSEPGFSPVNNTTSRSSALLFQRYTVSPAFQLAAESYGLDPPVRICAQPELATVRVNRQHHMVTT